MHSGLSRMKASIYWSVVAWDPGVITTFCVYDLRESVAGTPCVLTFNPFGCVAHVVMSQSILLGAKCNDGHGLHIH